MDVDTKYGPLKDAQHVERWPDGTLKSCWPTGRSPLKTPVGDILPLYETDDARKLRLMPVEFFEDGSLKSVSLQEQAKICAPLGEMDAEALVFYPGDRVRRFFPLRGNLSGYWTVANEYELARAETIPTPAGELTAKLLSVAFHESGALRSLTFWPRDEVTLPTPVGQARVRVGVAFFEAGEMRSFEPAQPIPVPTPLGELTAFDPDPEGVHGDLNSLEFDRAGRVVRVSVPFDRVTLGGKVFEPGYDVNACDGGLTDIVPLRLSFRYASGVASAVRVHLPPNSENPDRYEEFPLPDTEVRVEREVVQAKPILYHCFEELG